MTRRRPAGDGTVRKRKDGTAELSGSSVRRAHTVLHACLKAAVQEGLIPLNPTEGAVIPGNHHPPKIILNDEQLDRFRTAIEAEPVWHDFFYTEITTGLRLGELCGLKWSDFDEESGRLNVQRSVSAKLEIGETKTENGKRKAFHPAAAQYAAGAAGTEEDGSGRVDLSAAAEAGGANASPFGLQSAQGHSQEGGTAGHPFPRPAPYVRHHVAGTRHGYQNAVRLPRTHFGRNNAGCLQLCFRPDAASGCGEDRAWDRQR